VNQKLAKLMLSKAGYQVDVAGTGREAVEKYTAAPGDYDLIFMDIQMPDMDGIEATCAIREFHQSAGNGGAGHIPIVAMTAHAMKGDRERCIEAGMDDYTTKPIKRETVLNILEKWVFREAGAD
jgi:CheY-like chemotaxis protein